MEAKPYLTLTLYRESREHHQFATSRHRPSPISSQGHQIGSQIRLYLTCFYMVSGLLLPLLLQRVDQQQ